MALTLRVNGVEHQVEVAPDQRLLYVLRDYIGLTGTKYGCGEGRCGACTVLIDGKVTRSCMTPAASAVGKPITTIEGLEHDGQLHPVQEAFQCGYCTSGAILSAVSLPNKNPHLTDREIIAFLKGNVCRCGTFLGVPEFPESRGSEFPELTKTHSAWVPANGLVQIAVSSMLRLDCPPSTQLYLRSTVDTAPDLSSIGRMTLVLGCEGETSIFCHAVLLVGRFCLHRSVCCVAAFNSSCFSWQLV
jgi:aerobic-type carbon monoxide dehydrogenase small subunit (CoxS/CutS family)